MPPAVDLPELLELQRIVDEGGAHLQRHDACVIDCGGQRRFPVPVITLGNSAPEVPAIGFFGGVHGLERIGAEVVIAYLRSLVMRLGWDTLLHRQLELMRFVFMPLVNPGGLWRGTRANPNGVDLMRNAPVEAREAVAPLVGGQRLGAWLPWYRGATGTAMEAESAALCRVVESELLPRRFSIAIDCHSGFGQRDRIWFPHAHTRRPIERLPELHALATIFDRTHAQHRYVIEPQSRQYLAHGDLWDHLYLHAETAVPEHVFLPLTLEMGSWLWVRKNPRQVFRRHGLFNPLIEHRQQRVLRTHIACLDFMARAACGHAAWLPVGDARMLERELAYNRWYRRVS